jgi:hypothetical protein
MCQLHPGSSGRRSAALKLGTETKVLGEVSQGYHVQGDVSRKTQLHENITQPTDYDL